MDNVKHLFGTKVANTIDEHWEMLLNHIGEGGDHFCVALIEALQVYGPAGGDFRYGLDFAIDDDGAALLCTRHSIFSPATPEAEGMGNRIMMPRLHTMIHARKGPEGTTPPNFFEMHGTPFMQEVMDYIEAVDGLGGMDMTTHKRPGFVIIYIILTSRFHGCGWRLGQPKFDEFDMYFDVWLPRMAWYRVTFKYGILLSEHQKWLAQLEQLTPE